MMIYKLIVVKLDILKRSTLDDVIKLFQKMLLMYKKEHWYTWLVISMPAKKVYKFAKVLIFCRLVKSFFLKSFHYNYKYKI